jgi:phosphonoacetaldehyde hydrolase
MKLLNPRIPPGWARAGKLQALVLDWAGTTVDFGSVAPARTLQKVFANAKIPISEAEARHDMGLPKKMHIERILGTPRVSDAWQSGRGHAPTPADAEELYQAFIPLQFSCLAQYSFVIPEVIEAVRHFRERGLKIGSTTGYTRAMLDLLLASSAKQGYTPDCAVAPEDVGSGRPLPFMIYENAIKLQVYPLAAIAKVGDTPADIEEGLNAGCWSIGVAGTGNSIGLSYDEFQALPAEERCSRLANARAELERAGAHYVVNTLGDLDPVLDDIHTRLN